MNFGWKILTKAHAARKPAKKDLLYHDSPAANTWLAE